MNAVANNEIAALFSDRRPMAQMALTTFLVSCGLFMIVLVAPPSPWWTGGVALRGDRCPGWLALGLLGVFLATIMIPFTRRFYDLVGLGWPEVAVTALAVAVWVVLVRWFWRGRVLQRFIGLTPAGSSDAVAQTPPPFERLRMWLRAHGANG